MILYNNNIKGIHINYCSYKRSQFVNDTTIFLYVSVDPLLEALNTFEIYGCLSGIVVNANKTKLVWLGKKILRTQLTPREIIVGNNRT